MTTMAAPSIEEAHKLFLQGQLSAAQAMLLQLLDQTPGHVDALHLMGLIAQQLGDLDRALTYLSDAVRLEPRADLLANLGNVLRALERYDQALSYLKQAVRLAPDHALIHINLGLVHQDLRRLSEAEDAFRAALTLQPDLAIAHQNLGHLLMQFDLPQARTHLIRALQLSPGMHAAFKDLCGVLIGLGQAEPVLALCSARLQDAPRDQDALALMALALRDLGRDKEAEQMINYDVWLRTYIIAPPPGYRSLEEFNAALAAHIRQHPKLTSVLFGQATHHGKRVNDLLAEPKGPMRLFEQIALTQIKAYLDALPWIPSHPFFAEHLPSRTRLRSWGILMERHGYETPHIHPDGFVSGVYYVNLPDVVAKNDAAGSGWVEFGAPDPLIAAQRPPPVRQVQPVAGTMLLFPSYFWHRTIPFDSQQEHLSIAFDLTPAQ